MSRPENRRQLDIRGFSHKRPIETRAARPPRVSCEVAVQVPATRIRHIPETGSADAAAQAELPANRQTETRPRTARPVPRCGTLWPVPPPPAAFPDTADCEYRHRG